MTNKKQPTRLNTFKHLGQLFPKLKKSDPQKLWQLALQIHNNDKTEKYTSVISKALAENEGNSFNRQDEILKMYHHGYNFEQIFLYLDAPDQSPLHTQTTKQQYLKLWHADTNFKPTLKTHEVIDRSKFALSSISALIVTPIVFGGVSLALLANNVDIAEVSVIMSDGFGGISDDLLQAMQQLTIENWKQLLFGGLGVGYGVTKFKSAVEQAKECDLHKNIRETDPNIRKTLIEHIDQLSVSSRHLLTHLAPEELELFLVSNDKIQENILKTRPPSFDQRCRSLLSSDTKMATKWRENLKLACAKWENDVEMFDHPVTLKASLLKIRREMQPSPTAVSHKI